MKDYIQWKEVLKSDIKWKGQVMDIGYPIKNEFWGFNKTGFPFLNSKHECNVKSPLSKNRFTKCLMWFEMQWNSQIVWSSGAVALLFEKKK